MAYNPVNFFLGERKLCTCPGKEDQYVLFSRVGKSAKRFYISNVQYGNMAKDSTWIPGDMIFDGNDHHFLVAKRDGYNVDRAEFYRQNCTVDITRPAKHFTGSNQDYYTETLVQLGIYSVFEDINGNMRQYDIGLLQTTTRRFLLSGNIPLQNLDRIKFRGEMMQVDYINTSDFYPFLYVQCSPDKRVVKP